jgi:prephenate dehydrogenase
MEENNQNIHFEEKEKAEKEKEQISDEIIISTPPAVEEHLANELINKVKRKYTKKTAL